MPELTEAQRVQNRDHAHATIEARLRETRKAWAPALRTPNIKLATAIAMDALGETAAEILMDGTMLRALTIKDGVATLELEPATDILKIFVASMRGVLDGYGAENYVETEMSAPSVAMDLRHGPDPRDSYTVTIQRRTNPTPHEFRVRAEARAAELEKTLGHVTKLVGGWRQASDEHARFAQSKVMDETPGLADKQHGRSNQLADCANELNDVLNGDDPDDWMYGIGMDVTEAGDRDA